jgi:hypothetical protein
VALFEEISEQLRTRFNVFDAIRNEVIRQPVHYCELALDPDSVEAEDAEYDDFGSSADEDEDEDDANLSGGDRHADSLDDRTDSSDFSESPLSDEDYDDPRYSRVPPPVAPQSSATRETYSAHRDVHRDYANVLPRRVHQESKALPQPPSTQAYREQEPDRASRGPRTSSGLITDPTKTTRKPSDSGIARERMRSAATPLPASAGATAHRDAANPAPRRGA